MINKNAFEQSIPLATIFANKDLKIKSREGTPLHNLVQSTVLTEVITADEDVDGDPFSVESLSSGSDNDSHNAYFDQTIELLSKSLVSQVNNIKNVISPIVTEASEKIVERMAAESGSELSYKIVPVGLPEPMKNSSLEEAIHKSGGGIYANPDKYLKLPSKENSQEVIELMLTGSNEFDEKIKEWSVSFPGCEKFFIGLWNQFFNDEPVAVTNASVSLLELFGDKVHGVNSALAVYLLSRKLLDDVPEKTNMALAEYKRAVGQYLEVASLKLNEVYKLQDSIVKNGSLVISNDKTSKTVLVNQDVYLDFINSGGKNETIFGALAEGTVPYMVSSLVGKESEYQTAWDRYSLFNKATLKNKIFITFKDICLYVLLAQLAEVSDSETSLVEINSNHMFEVSKLIEKYISELSIKDMEDPYQVALKAVADIRFNHTDAYRFLTTINDICIEDANIDVREAALIATTEYVTDYLIDQMVIA